MWEQENLLLRLFDFKYIIRILLEWSMLFFSQFSIFKFHFFFQMCHMHDRICFRWPCEIPAMPSYLPYQMHRRLVNAELYLSILHGASGRGTFDYVRKPILNKEWVAIVRAHMCDVWSHVCVLKKVYPVRYVCHVEQLYRTTMLKTICE